jgi:hypothetical protein
MIAARSMSTRRDAQSIRDHGELRWGRLAELRLGQRQKQALAVQLDVDEPLPTLQPSPAASSR